MAGFVPASDRFSICTCCVACTSVAFLPEFAMLYLEAVGVGSLAQPIGEYMLTQQFNGAQVRLPVAHCSGHPRVVPGGMGCTAEALRESVAACSAAACAPPKLACAATSLTCKQPWQQARF